MVELTFTTGISKNLMQNVHYNFMGYQTFFLIWYSLFAAFGFILYPRFAQSIDFTGGRNFVVQFEQL